MDMPSLSYTIAREVAAILEVAPEQLQPDTPLAGFDTWDSVAVVAFAAAMAEHFGCSFESAEIVGAETVEALTALVRRRMDGAA